MEQEGREMRAGEGPAGPNLLHRASCVFLFRLLADFFSDHERCSSLHAVQIRQLWVTVGSRALDYPAPVRDPDGFFPLNEETSFAPAI